MRLFQFTSQAKPTIHAFAGDAKGTKLPSQLAPWSLTRILSTNQALPHRLPRDVIERGIHSTGYQLWRLKTAQKPAPAAKA